jgi:hypothetical protein
LSFKKLEDLSDGLATAPTRQTTTIAIDQSTQDCRLARIDPSMTMTISLPTSLGIALNIHTREMGVDHVLHGENISTIINQSFEMTLSESVAIFEGMI